MALLLSFISSTRRVSHGCASASDVKTETSSITSSPLSPNKVIAGLHFLYAKPLRIGELPGDVTIGGRAWQISILLGTSLLLSLILTIALNLFLRRR